MSAGGDAGSGARDRGSDARASVTFPIRCEYRGGNTALGPHGKHLWIVDGRIGHGELKLTRSIPLSDVRSVEVIERSVGGADIQIVAMPGLPLTRQVPGAGPRQITEVTVRSADGQEALWLILTVAPSGPGSGSVLRSAMPGSRSTRTCCPPSEPRSRNGHWCEDHAGWVSRIGIGIRTLLAAVGVTTADGDGLRLASPAARHDR